MIWGGNMKTFDIEQTGCVAIRGKKGVGQVCVGTERDMGNRSATLIMKDSEKTYSKIPDLAKGLRKEGFPQKERAKVLEFVGRQFRDIQRQKSGGGIGVGLPGGSRISGEAYKEIES